MNDEVIVTLTYTTEEASEVARTILYFTSNVSATHEDHDRMALIRSAIKGALPPPRIDEPGTWGVVEASCCHSDERRKWVRHEDDNWWPAETYGSATVRLEKGRDPRLPDCWDDLVDPVLVREGVAS